MAETENSLNLQQSRACSPRVRACAACSCSNIAVFPYGGQECMHVSPNPSGRRWNRPQRWREGERERAGFPPHPSLFMQGLPPCHGPTHTPAILYDRLYGLLSAKRSGNAPEEINSRQLSFMMRLTSWHCGEHVDLRVPTQPTSPHS